MGVHGPGRLRARPQVFHDDGSDLVDQMFRARARLFHDRLKWDVTVDERGHERDQYDTPVARYLILADAAGRHVASCRFIPLTEPNMTCDAFPGLFDRSMIADSDRAVEITRFCVTSGGREMSAQLFEAGFEWLAGTEFTSIIAVFFPAMLRVCKRAGWVPKVLNSVDGLVVGQWVPHAVGCRGVER